MIISLPDWRPYAGLARHNGRYIEGGCRIQSAADSGAAIARRSDGFRSHRDPGPVSAPRLPTPQAAAGSRTDRALPGGLLGVLPPFRRGCLARFRAAFGGGNP